ncbi:DUF2637 domain-containing protein [Bailinhaonella thermotolerans]
MTPSAEDPPKELLRAGQELALIAVSALALALVANSLYASYRAILQLATRIGAAAPEQIAISFEASLVVIVAWDIVLTWVKRPAPLLRWGARVLTVVSVVANAAVGWPDVRAMLMYVPAPVVILTIVESVRHVLLQRHRQREPIPLPRWLWHPASSLCLHRLMVKWEINSYRQALATQQRVEHAKRQLEVHFGDDWRQLAPADLVWMLDEWIMLDDAFARVRELVAGTATATGDNAAGTKAADDNNAEQVADTDNSSGDDKPDDDKNNTGDKRRHGNHRRRDGTAQGNRRSTRDVQEPASDKKTVPVLPHVVGTKHLRSKRAERMRQIAEILHADPLTPTAEIAESLAVDPRTVQRDIVDAPEYGFLPRELVAQRLALLSSGSAERHGDDKTADDSTPDDNFVVPPVVAARGDSDESADNISHDSATVFRLSPRQVDDKSEMGRDDARVAAEARLVAVGETTT